MHAHVWWLKFLLYEYVSWMAELAYTMPAHYILKKRIRFWDRIDQGAGKHVFQRQSKFQAEAVVIYFL